MSAESVELFAGQLASLTQRHCFCIFAAAERCAIHSFTFRTPSRSRSYPSVGGWMGSQRRRSKILATVAAMCSSIAQVESEIPTGSDRHVQRWSSMDRIGWSPLRLCLCHDPKVRSHVAIAVGIDHLEVAQGRCSNSGKLVRGCVASDLQRPTSCKPSTRIVESISLL